MRLFRINLVVITLVFLGLAMTAAAQTKRNASKRPAPTATPTATPDSATDPTPERPAIKRNGRPTAEPVAKPSVEKVVPVYFYTFTRPGFTYSRVEIEHDEAGKGTISFQKSSFDEAIIDPIDLSAATMKNINEAVTALDFLESSEEYQFERDYSHLGNIEFKLKKNGRERTVKYNWTENKNAKMLMDEYRRISNEYTWRFEIITARENQPLLTPGLMDAIDSYLKRNEISDPRHLLPFLTELSNDERLPLMGRNRASKLIKEIEKTKK